MKPGDIVLLRFPQADLVAGKLRPALVVAIAPERLRRLKKRLADWLMK